ncbi:MAG: InlB B-repeat-containing protein [Candidatus Coproplasma sp.]
MKIKKIVISLLTVLCIVCAFALAACGNNGSNDDPKATYYTVTFHANIWGTDEDVTEKSVESGKTAADKVPTNLIHSGYIFDGWCTDEALTQDFDIENTPITSDISLYARWKKDTVYDRAWFLSELEKCTANASADAVARTTVSYKAKIDGASAQSFTSTIENDSITVGSYNVRMVITADWFENEFLNGVTVTSEIYRLSSTVGQLTTTIHFTNAQNENHIMTFSVDEYGYLVGGSRRIDNGSGNATTTLYVISSVTYN